MYRRRCCDSLRFYIHVGPSVLPVLALFCLIRLNYRSEQFEHCIKLLWLLIGYSNLYRHIIIQSPHFCKLSISHAADRFPIGSILSFYAHLDRFSLRRTLATRASARKIPSKISLVTTSYSSFRTSSSSCSRYVTISLTISS